MWRHHVPPLACCDGCRPCQGAGRALPAHALQIKCSLAQLGQKINPKPVLYRSPALHGRGAVLQAQEQLGCVVMDQPFSCSECFWELLQVFPPLVSAAHLHSRRLMPHSSSILPSEKNQPGVLLSADRLKLPLQPLVTPLRLLQVRAGCGQSTSGLMRSKARFSSNVNVLRQQLPFHSAHILLPRPPKSLIIIKLLGKNLHPSRTMSVIFLLYTSTSKWQKKLQPLIYESSCYAGHCLETK